MDIPVISDQTAAGLTPFEPNPDKVFICFDGSISSAVCAQILKDQGFAVEGFYFAPDADTIQQNKVKEMAQKIGIPLSYISLQIPQEIDAEKTDFSILYLSLINDLADESNVKFIASGHNAKIIETDAGFTIVSGEESSYNHAERMQDLPISILEKLCLPNGEFTKEEIQEMASALNYI